MNLAIISIAALLLGQTTPASATANPSASPGTRAVLDILVKLPSRGEKRILSGQFTDYGPGAKLELCFATDGALLRSDLASSQRRDVQEAVEVRRGFDRAAFAKRLKRFRTKPVLT